MRKILRISFSQLLLLSVAFLLLGCGSRPFPAGSDQQMFVGSYTQKMGHVDGQGKGIYYMEREGGDSWNLKHLAAPMENPSFVKATKDGKYLYAVSELGPGTANSGFLHSFEIQEEGSLEFLGRVPTGNFAPCHINMDPQEKYVFVANYAGSPVNVYKRRPDGTLKHYQDLEIPDPVGSHPHSVLISPDGKKVYVADLGNDKIWIFTRNASRTGYGLHPKEAISLVEGAGPRHLSLSREGSHLYSANELNSTVSVFKIAKDGFLQEVQQLSSLPTDFKGTNYPADIHVHPSKPYLYVSNRGHNSIAIYQIDTSGRLLIKGFAKTEGETPRNFTFSPEGTQLLVANQDTSNLVIFEIDPQTGLLHKLSETSVPTPVSLEILGHAQNDPS